MVAEEKKTNCRSGPIRINYHYHYHGPRTVITSIAQLFSPLLTKFFPPSLLDFMQVERDLIGAQFLNFIYL